MEGIENIKTCIGFVLDLTDDVQKSLADGKFNIKDSILFVDNIPQLPKAVRAASKFWAEFQDLDEAEKTEIENFVIQRLNCSSEKAKKIIVQAFVVAIAVADTVVETIEMVKTIKAA